MTNAGRSRRQDDKDDKGSKPLGKAPLLDLLLSLGILNNPLDPDFCSVCDNKLLLFAPSDEMEPVLSTFEGQFLISEYRQFSKARETVANILYYDSLYYLCLLKSQREAMDLFLRYKGRGERSVEETAGLVGFKLPKQYQDP